MTPPAPTSKVLLLAENRAATATSGPVRRYRLARLRLDSRSTDPAHRFDHIKRSYD
jgi:hypothetical protein